MQSRIRLGSLALAAFGVALASSAGAEDPPTPAESKLAIHGYLTQGYAASDGVQLIGIPHDGTVDYRRVALQFRYSATEQDSVVLQLAQRRLGESPIRILEPDVKLDWAYYEHAFPTSTTVRVGRMPLPRGLLNEIRYAGTVLPLYRLPYSVYQEGAFTSETLDGARVRQTIGKGAWSAEVTAYGGGYSILEVLSSGVNQATAKNVYGGQLVLSTPLDGLRFIVGGQRSDLRQTTLNPTGRDRVGEWNVGAELVRERFTLRSEYAPLFLDTTGFALRSYYVYGGVGVTNKLWVHGELNQANLGITTPTGFKLTANDFHHDLIAGLSYALRSYLVAKAEYHWAKTRRPENDKGIAKDFDPTASPDPVQFFILSLSASF
jgi:hypothetical protein